jgi:acylphosphatase
VKRVRARASIAGRVQGVWFRESTRQKADELHLSGWVRNCGNGDVEAVFEGTSPDVERALEFVGKGPPMARVTGVQVVYEPPLNSDDETPFRVRA